MPPKKKVIQKKIESVNTQSAQTPRSPVTSSERSGAGDVSPIRPYTINDAKLVELVPTNQSPYQEVKETESKVQSDSPYVGDKKESIPQIICFDSINNKTQQQILEERKAKFGCVGPAKNQDESADTTMNQQKPQQKKEKQAINRQQQNATDLTNVESLLKEFSETERQIFKDRIIKFGLSENELKSLIAEQKNAVKVCSGSETKTTKDKWTNKRQHKEDSSIFHRRHENLRRNDIMSRHKNSVKDHSRSRDQTYSKHRKYSSKYHQKCRR